ncbi:hypothetical protein ACT4S5_18495 [Kocuria oceani]|uniref:hypothetical protein n=1 Tax=Kocuria oceani TaxID=988827 RepID=UPI00403554CB
MDEFVGGVVQQLALEPGQVQVGVDLHLVGVPADAEVVQPEAMHRDAGGAARE